MFLMCYHIEGKSNLNEPFKKRTEFLKKIFTQTPFKIIYSKQLLPPTKKKLRKFYEASFKKHQEGVKMKI
jgi:ATP-dependent DNA ligase